MPVVRRSRRSARTPGLTRVDLPFKAERKPSHELEPDPQHPERVAVTAGATAFLIATGCTELPGGVVEYSASWVDPKITTGLIAGTGLVKTLINVGRDGIGGLIKRQPPVR